MTNADHGLGAHVLENALARFRSDKALGERAIAQVGDADLTQMLDAESNSIATIVWHLSGNMRSRWTDFLTTDGEKPDRHRDSEFDVELRPTREEVLERWESGWSYVFAAIEALTPEDLTKTVTIRGEAHTVVEAITRQLTHYACHVGQIVFLAKHFRSDDWKTLSVARGKSADYRP